MSEAPIAQSALQRIYTARGAAMANAKGWHAPAHFGSADAEAEAAQTAVAVGELFGGAWDIVGADLGELATRLGVEPVPAGAAAPLDLTGVGMVRWLRLTRDHACVLAGRPAMAAVRSALEAPGSCLHLTDVSSGLTTLAVLGPRSPDLLARLVRLDLDPRVFRDRHLALTGAAGIPLQVLRWDRGPLLAYELTVGRDVAEYWWEALTHASDGLGLQPIGTEAMAVLERNDGV